jgi:ribosome recycling factor
LSELRQELNRNIDEVFAQARSNLNNIVTTSNEKHLKKLLKCKHHLSDADRKLKELKSTLDTNWRKVAGEMFATSFDQKI